MCVLDIARVLCVVALFAINRESIFVFGDQRNFKAQLICTQTHMVVYLTTVEDDFSGVIYTEGSYKDPFCLREIGGGGKIVFKVPYDGCGTTMENGLYSNVVIVQHHERIMTGDDAAFKLVCDQTNLMSGSNIIVTESMHMVHNSYSQPETELKPRLKHLYQNKKVKVISNEKGTFTYLPTQNKTASLPA